MTSLLQLFILAGALFSHLAAAQNCGCASNLCCSKYGYCGTSAAYCGDGCQQGPCFSGGGGGGGGGVNVADVVSDGFFNGMLNQAADSCAGKRFYSRRAFLIALRSYPKFGKEGSADVAKREIAAFFAHVTHETGHFCYINEINGASRDYCDKSNTQWPCNPNKKYFGRGPIQLSWNFNYGPAGKSIGFDGLNNPEAVSEDPVVAFKTAFWYWMNHVHSLILSNRGFGSTIRAINSIECNGGNTPAINSRVRYYIQYCKQLGISPGTNLRC